MSCIESCSTVFGEGLRRPCQSDFTLFGTFGYDAVQNQYFGGLNISIGGQGPSSMPFSTQAINR